MDERKLVQYVAALITAIEETERKMDRVGKPVPASVIYLGFDSDMDIYNAVIGAAKRVGWIDVTPTIIALTEKGRERAAKINKEILK